ncbi:MAG: helix-turn-helix domain-containing protein [Anaerolineales bacterium]
MDVATQGLEASTTMPDLDEFLTTDQAAKALDFTVESVRQLVYKKKLESQRFGRSILIPKKAIREYLEKTKGMNKRDPRRSLKK